MAKKTPEVSAQAENNSTKSKKLTLLVGGVIVAGTAVIFADKVKKFLTKEDTTEPTNAP